MLLKTISQTFANAVHHELNIRNIELSSSGMEKAYGIDRIGLRDGLTSSYQQQVTRILFRH